jgi:outer membrane protein OmpA-like peptidoglycan-associated protein
LRYVLLACYPVRKYGIILFLAISVPAFAQHYDPNAVPDRAKRWYDKARETLLMATDPGRFQAVPFLQKAINEYSGFEDAYILAGSIYEKARKYTEAIPYFEKANLIDSAYFLPGYYMYARAEAGVGNFAKALQLIGLYLQQPDLHESSRRDALLWRAHYEFGLKSEEQHIPFNPINLGDSINSVDPEYFPTLPIDQKTLIFTRRVNNVKEDFFISHLLPDSQWSKAKPLILGSQFLGNRAGGNVNSPYNEGAETISQDGKILIYTICDRPGGMGSCDIYYAVRTDSGWSQPYNIGPPVNTPYWESQPCLSPDNRDLYFVSNRPGGYGGSDIYVSHLQPGGTWGQPVNLGPDINTAGDESSPFIHADNQTLYFASSGWPGVGGVDLYYSRRQPDGSWSKPHNLGYPINTIDHDGSIFVTADGKTAYFASDRSDSHGELDIYKFELYAGAQPVHTLYVQGYVYDNKTNKRLTATLELIDLGTGKTLTSVPTDQDGSYLVTLPVGKNYAFEVSKQGYLFFSDNFSLKDSTGGKPFQINIGLEPIEVNAHVVLKNIFFDFDKYTLKPESETELDKLVQLLKLNPNVNIRLNGYTDSVGSAEHNLILSQNRAQAVVNYLISKGISESRLSAKGYGSAHPVAPNDTEEGRALNRRTELVVTEDK